MQSLVNKTNKIDPQMQHNTEVQSTQATGRNCVGLPVFQLAGRSELRPPG